MGDKIFIEWKSYLLRLEPKTPDRDKFVEYTKSWLRPAAMEPQAKFQVWNSDSPPPSSSLPAQVAAKTMERFHPEITPKFHRALLAAYFTDNRDISDLDVLSAVGAECGVDPVDFKAAMMDSNTEMTQLVINDHNSALERGVNAVPSVVINDAMVVPGAQDVAAYETWIERILNR